MGVPPHFHLKSSVSKMALNGLKHILATFFLFFSWWKMSRSDPPPKVEFSTFLAPTGAQAVTICLRLSVRFKLVQRFHSSSFQLKSSSNQSVSSLSACHSAAGACSVYILNQNTRPKHPNWCLLERQKPGGHRIFNIAETIPKADQQILDLAYYIHF